MGARRLLVSPSPTTTVGDLVIRECLVGVVGEDQSGGPSTFDCADGILEARIVFVIRSEDCHQLGLILLENLSSFRLRRIGRIILFLQFRLLRSYKQQYACSRIREIAVCDVGPLGSHRKLQRESPSLEGLSVFLLLVLLEQRNSYPSLGSKKEEIPSR